MAKYPAAPEAADQATAAPVASTDEPAKVTLVSAPPATPPQPNDARPPAALYAQCLDRAEQPQKDGECTTDADCQTAGCSSEVCTTATEAANVMSTCEVQPCYAVLDACGCVEGVCSWSLKQATPEPTPILKVPRTGEDSE